MTQTDKGKKAASLAASGTLLYDPSDKGKLSTGKPRTQRSGTSKSVSTNLVIRDGNEMWYSITDKPMINKLIKLGLFQSTIGHSTAKRKIETLKEKAAEGEFRLVVGKDLWLSAPVEIPKGAKLCTIHM